ncbi:hypothetical protein EON65_38255 [archaeon]|nr:MAG: hypothetical protein EON65_38255 [archaeon]
MLARCTIPLSHVLKSKPVLYMRNHPLFSARTGQAIATINVDIRLALPISELYKLFLERHPDEKKYIENFATKRLMEASKEDAMRASLTQNNVGLLSAEDESRLFNELEIIIHRAGGLPVDGKIGAPSSYVHFIFLGNPDKFTNPVMDSASPEFNEKFSFPMLTSDQQLRLMMRTKLQLNVVNMKEEDNKQDDSYGLIGEVFVNMAEICDGKTISDAFLVKDRLGKPKGELVLTVKWRYPLRKQRELGPRSLTGVEVENLIAAFSPSNIKEGVIDYHAFCKFATPTAQVIDAMQKIRAYFDISLEKSGKAKKEILQTLFPTDKGIKMDTFVTQMLKTKAELIPTELESVFKHIDTTDLGEITPDQIFTVLNLDELSGIPTSLQNKLYDCVKDLRDRGIKLRVLFDSLDQWGANGLISRAEFKRGLKRMGFSLVDEPEPIQEVMADKHIAGEATDMLDDTLDSQDHIMGAGADGLAVADFSHVDKCSWIWRRSRLPRRVTLLLAWI